MEVADLFNEFGDKIIDRVFNIDKDTYEEPIKPVEAYGPHEIVLKINCIDVPIYFGKQLNETGVYGYFENRTCNPYIFINDACYGHMRELTIYHEVLHAYTYFAGHCGRKLEEEIWVDFAASCITSLSRDNPHFQKWIEAERNKLHVVEDQEEKERE